MANNEYNIDDKYTIVVEEQDTFQLELNKQGPQGERGPIGPIGPQGDKGEKGDQGIQGEVGPKGDTGVSVVGVEEISKVGLVATYRMEFSNGEYFDYEVADGSIDGLTREEIINIIGYEPASYTSVEGLTTRVSTLEERFTDIQTSLDSKQDKLTAGENITIVDNVISSKGGGSGLELCDIGMALYIDETKGLRRYLNGQIVDINTNTQAFLNRLLQIQTTNPEYFTTEENWQTESTLNIDGCVYKFVLNYIGDSVVSVRLPKYPDYVEINAGGTLPVVGNGMTLGLTNNSENFGVDKYLTNSSLLGNPHAYGVPTGSSVTDAGMNSKTTIGVTTDPTKSGIQTTLKQTKLKLRYFIQIATGSETENNIINEIELNNPYSLFECKYADHELFNLSWLVSNGTYNGSNAVHPGAYQALLVENNAEVAIGSTVTLPNGVKYTKQGLSVKLSTEAYTDYDFVLNTTEGKFRLPIKPRNLNNTRYLIEAGEQNGIYYRVYSDGWCEQGGHYTHNNVEGTVTTTFIKPFINTNYNLQITKELGSSPASGTDYQFISSYVASSKTTSQFQVRMPTANRLNGYDWQACGYLAEGEYIPLTDNILLYYYVGETVQNANLIDAGRIGEQLADKVNMLQASGAGMPSSKYIDLTLGASGSTYTAPANGWFYAYAHCNSAGHQNSLVNITKEISIISPPTTNSYSFDCKIYIPVQKNDIVQYGYTQHLIDAYSKFRFIYAEGSK